MAATTQNIAFFIFKCYNISLTTLSKLRDCWEIINAQQNLRPYPLRKDRRNVKGLATGTSPWLAIILAALYFSLMTAKEIMRVRDNPDKPRSSEVHVYFVSALVFGVAAGIMFGHTSSAWHILTSFGLAVYVLGVYYACFMFKMVPNYDRVILVVGGFNFLLSVSVQGHWMTGGAILEDITLLVVAVTLALRTIDGCFRLLHPRHQ